MVSIRVEPICSWAEAMVGFSQRIFMTTQRTLKKQIRDRMKRNDERYTTARAHVLAGRAQPKKQPHDFTGGQQGDVAAATNAINAAGIRGPGGLPLTEAQVFGLSGGVGFLYGVFRYDTGPTMTIVARNTSMPDTFLDQLWGTPGLDATVFTTGGAKKAQSELLAVLERGERALCSVGAGALGYLGLPAESSAMQPLVVGVIGTDQDQFLIDDRSVEPHRVDSATLAHARAVLRSAKHRMVTIAPGSQIQWDSAISQSIETGAKRYDTPPVPQFASNVGIAGLTKWHRLLTDRKDRMGWPRVFGDGPHAAIGLSRLYECIEHEYTAPAAGRPLYTEFLRWAHDVVGTDRYVQAAEAFESSAHHWSAISDIAATANPSIAEAVSHIDRRAELQGDGDRSALEQAYDAQTTAVDTATVSSAEASAAATAIADEVQKIIELETAALQALGHIPAPPKSRQRSTAPAEDRVTMLNPNTGRSDKTIARAIYDPVKRAILTAINEIDELRFSDLSTEVESRSDAELWKKHKVGWYTTSVKLDLEARGLIERFKSPQRLRLTEAGKAALADT